MKKGHSIILALLMAVIVLLSSSIVSAYVCTDGVSPTECVCGHTPNSALGYGQVIIGASTVISCNHNNDGDGICPEDFIDASTGIVANCNNCPDPDCTATVYGYVKDSTGKPIEKVLIKGSPVKWNASANLDRSAPLTNTLGVYTYSGFITGKYYFSASKDSYDTGMIEANITRGKTISLNFTLNNGTCHDDCTNSYNRCNKKCNGMTFGDGVTSTSCSFYNSTIAELCDNRMIGTEVFVRTINATTSEFVKCCEESPKPKYYTQFNVSNSGSENGNIKNLVKNEKIAKRDSVLTRVIVVTWQN
jgi:hypothetical protein